MRRKSNLQGKSKHQHWVPQFYLKYFATSESRLTKNPQVWIFSKGESDGDESLTNVRNICGKRYLYSPLLPDGQRNWDLDDRLNNLESLLSRIWSVVASDFVSFSDSSIRKGIALFVAVMYLRNPEMRKNVEEIHKQLLDLYTSVPVLADGTPAIGSVQINGKAHDVDTRDWHQYRAWGKNEHDKFFADTLCSEASKLAQLLMRKRWSVIVSETDAFITSDRPVTLQHSTLSKFGFGTQGSVLMFPLSPTRVLVMDDIQDKLGDQYYKLTDRGSVVAINMSIWHGSSRFFITGRSVVDVLTEFHELVANSSDT